jgi:mannose-6-phosphate isomerase-like protein (cupin superfamily)
MANYMVEQLDEIDAVECPCGMARRGFTSPDNAVATAHMTDISEDARPHYHKKLTEVYVVLEGQGHMELDGDHVPVKPLTAVLIKPGCRHRAVGRMRIIIMVVPAFDPDDEWFDTE